MISLTSVTKQFKEKKAVSQVSFEGKIGEIIGFLGVNGAGKTTTMRLILGYLLPSNGTVRIGQKNPATQRLSVLKTIGYLPENNPLYPEMKVREYLQFIAEVKNVKEWYSVVEAVSLDEMVNTKIEELSRGYKQRVGLAAALIGDPEILILDEPTSGLDPIEQDKIRILIKKLAKKKIILFSTHILSEVEDIATRLVIINKGSLVYDGEKPKTKGSVEKLFKKLVKE
ncbi:ATP-binding cassette domain-containing protein [Candidatus Roizmanbacteria bacterium]|nr:ATP-binding cassette domain-containing protein [Candidatus Roizmanbacteria bacterium]